MSKLNDSTLKIFKKYRLDTNMSVFGDENKLYDVVKVMDDMVGNQVSKYVAQTSYLDSNSIISIQAYKTNSALKDYDIDYSKVLESSSDVYAYDPLTMKYIGTIPDKSPVFPLGILSVNNQDYGYVIYNNETKKMYISNDIQGSTNLTGSNVNGIVVYKPLYLVSKSFFRFYISSGVYANVFLTASSSTKVSVNNNTIGVITLPEQFKEFVGKSSYYSFGGYSNVITGISCTALYVSEV